MNTGIVNRIETSFKTYIGPTGAGTLDIMLANHNIIFNYRVTAGDVTTSDHIPIISELNSSPILIPTLPKFSLANANWQQFREDLSGFVSIDLDGCHNSQINRVLLNMMKEITTAMNHHIPKRHYHPINYTEPSILLTSLRQRYKRLEQTLVGRLT